MSHCIRQVEYLSVILMGSFSSSEAVSTGYIPGDVEVTSASDQQLIESVAHGDEIAFGELYSRYKLSLYHYLLRLLNDQSSAEDILQEVFVAVWKGSGQFRARSTVKTWLFRIAHNQAISWHRRQKTVTDHRGEMNLASVEVDPETDLLKSWRSDQLREALSKLSPTHRAVVELSFVQGLTYNEIAQILDCPVGTIKSRMSYALRLLDGVLKRHGISH